MFSSGFSDMITGPEYVDLMQIAMGGQQCKESGRSGGVKRVHVEPVHEGLTLLDDYFICSPPKKPKQSETPVESGRPGCGFIVTSRESQAFHRLLAEPQIYKFLEADYCRRISDKYLIAMVFAYFKRGNYQIHEYNKINFFVALYLANDMEEDDEDIKYDIFPWALGTRWKSRYINFLKKREKLWWRIKYRAVVSKKCCEEIMSIEPRHWAWQRDRALTHGGATRVYRFPEEEEECYVRGPGSTPRQCDRCFTGGGQHDSGYFDETSWYFSHSSSSESEPEVEIRRPDVESRLPEVYSRLPEVYSRQPEVYSRQPEVYDRKEAEPEFFCEEPRPKARRINRFDMKGLQTTLADHDWVFPSEE